MSIAGIPNTQNLSHEQFGGSADAYATIAQNFKNRYMRSATGEHLSDEEPETRSSAFDPGAHGAQPEHFCPQY